MFEETSERRIVGALILLLGISFLAVGLQTNQIQTIIDILKGNLTAVLSIL